MAVSCCCNSYKCFIVAICVVIKSACLSMSSMRTFHIMHVICSWLAFCMLSRNGIEVCSIGVPSGRVMPCTREMPGTRKIALASLCNTRKSAGLRIS